MSNPKTLRPEGPPDEMERIKENSRYLRGTLVESFQDPISASIPEEDTKLLKFHGSYMQDDRDLRTERKKQKLEAAYQFMVRVRLPGGVATPEQWLTMDSLADAYGNGTIKLTTRQTFQLHGILKWNMKKSIQAMDEALMDSIAACGDVNRNVMSNVNPDQSAIHAEVHDWAKRVSEHLLPKTRAYHEIWLDEEKIVDGKEEEPIYGPHYLPRKFKIGLAVPPSNDVDVFSQDLGFIAIIKGGELLGFNVSIGGGMGMTHGNTNTYPQLGRVIGFCPADRITEVAEKVLTIQRDYGNRSDRKNARFKYTVDRLGPDWILQELNQRLGWSLEEAEPFTFDHNGDHYGWVKGEDGDWHHTLFIQNGRIKDSEDYRLKEGLRKIAEIHEGEFRLTPNQNVIISKVSEKNKADVEAIIEAYGMTDGRHNSALRRNSMACVALPTCGLAMAESERYLPSLIDKIEEILDETGLSEEEIVIRMSGCPNSCSRPALGEIGFIGKAPGKYNMYLGAGFAGDRLNKLYRENIGEEEILQELKPLFLHYAKERETKEKFGDFVIRKGYVKAVESGEGFHS
ncbi:assimilatory sulfite reductase (NADPH) hemoprotein subunit [Halobacillus karajensis]|uniref:Sulfite reductase [NADPH] hemoprotein beta-component n=1 Tax=Halobacillus karajensis TaxID=195088 RepID=A0A024P2F1_9BACI|nr:assimilatory sulfite reductase (NADPH) hemoprotein subunit [Halobacillus karajensis]CDQ19783.1 Sulfite reductase [NADPH] hemoprotein beta-component [Halobacillus karajensis]CDQ22243.1 Sulfite reductase [NADPH] hemoprotein beta-component [Halobacillus karajensis]CDQ28084.1 Sulfite reductase [NADPH] hemoprotein beta-component [Halobacillus karajensis]